MNWLLDTPGFNEAAPVMVQRPAASVTDGSAYDMLQ